MAAPNIDKHIREVLRKAGFSDLRQLADDIEQHDGEGAYFPLPHIRFERSIRPDEDFYFAVSAWTTQVCLSCQVPLRRNGHLMSPMRIVLESRTAEIERITLGWNAGKAFMYEIFRGMDYDERAFPFAPHDSRNCQIDQRLISAAVEQGVLPSSDPQEMWVPLDKGLGSRSPFKMLQIVGGENG